ncbi:MAG: DUF5060 domain-containing protein [Candidatus Marinimicrobia bacterium]|nr:DUF5060 domain-containing protein [Candidatus Neomarinimicrobiota bacterium]
MRNTLFVLLLLFVTVTACLSARDEYQVPLYGIFQLSVVNNADYSDPYRDVEFQITFTRPDSSTVKYWGFYDNQGIWRVRFMPDQLGTWKYSAKFKNGTETFAGTFDCVESNIPGLITKDQENPIWFGYSSGEHQLIRSIHVGDRFFAENWSDSARTVFLNWAQEQSYNMLSIASHLLNRDAEGRGKGWNTPDLWDSENNRPNPVEYRKMEAILDSLSERKILVYPFAGFFGQSSDFPVERGDQELYVKYTLARIGAYWNSIYNVAGPEPNVKPEEFRNQMDSSNVDRLGQLIQKYNTFDHLLSVHTSPNVGDLYPGADWNSYAILQGARGTDWQNMNQYILSNHTGDKPVYAQEMFWPGNNLHRVTEIDDIRKKGFVMLFSAAAINFADMDGNSSSGFSGSMDLKDRHQEWHNTMKQVWDWFETIPFYELSPAQDLVTSGYCLSDRESFVAIYYPDKDIAGEIDLTELSGNFSLSWYDPVKFNTIQDENLIQGGEIIKVDVPASVQQDGVLVLRKNK